MLISNAIGLMNCIYNISCVDLGDSNESRGGAPIQ